MSHIKKGVKHTNSDTLFNIVNYTFLSLIFVLVAYPVIYVISASFSDPFMVNSGQLWLFPKDFTIKGYQAALKDPALVRGFLNALFLTVAGTSINILCTVMLAFPLSRKDFYGRNMLTLLLTITMFFSGGLVPTFLLINNLGLYDSYWALILPSALTVSNVIICRTYFQSNIPEELYESSQLDGCSDVRFLIRIAVNMDPANLVMVTGDDPVAAVYTLKDYIVHTHAKDGIRHYYRSPEEVYGIISIEQPVAPSFLEVPLGEGKVDFPNYLRALEEIGYRGFLTIEREVGENPSADIKKAADYLTALIK